MIAEAFIIMVDLLCMYVDVVFEVAQASIHVLVPLLTTLEQNPPISLLLSACHLQVLTIEIHF